MNIPGCLRVGRTSPGKVTDRKRLIRDNERLLSDRKTRCSRQVENGLLFLKMHVLVKQLCLLSASVVFACQAYGQTKNLTAAKPGDFVFPERKYTYVELDNGTYDVWFRNALLYVDSVSRNNDSSLSAVHITNGYLFSFTVHFDDSEQNNYEEITTGRSTGIFICDTCSREGAYIPYICNDSTAFYSTHPSKPFRYGWAFSRAKSEELNREAFFMIFIRMKKC